MSNINFNSNDLHVIVDGEKSPKSPHSIAQACQDLDKPLPPLPQENQRKTRRSTWSWLKSPQEPTPRKRIATFSNTLKKMLGMESEELQPPSIEITPPKCHVAFEDLLQVDKSDLIQCWTQGKMQHSILGMLTLDQILLVDTRSQEEFVRGHITGSINVNVPSMFLKRARKNPKATKFHLESFLSSPDAKLVLEKWTETVKNSLGLLIVLDESMDLEEKVDLTGEGWATLMLLSRSLQGEEQELGLIRPEGVNLAYLNGGWKSFEQDSDHVARMEQPLIQTNLQAPESLSITITTPVSGVTLRGTPNDDKSTSLPVLSTTSSKITSNGSLFKIDTTRSSRSKKKSRLNKQISGSMPSMVQSRISIPSENSLNLEPALVVHTFASKDDLTPKTTSSDQVDSAATAVASAAGPTYHVSPLIVNTMQVATPVSVNVTPASPDRMSPMYKISLATIQSEGSVEKAVLDRKSSVSLQIEHSPRPFIRNNSRDHGFLTSPPTAYPRSPSSDSIIYSPSSASPSGSTTPGSGGDEDELRSGKQAPAACTQVLPNLFIGSEEMVSSVPGLYQLRHLGVTHILNVATEVHSPELLDSLGFKGYKRLEIRDHANEAMEGYLREAVSWMDEVLKEGGYIFVHCKFGISRSATVVLGYLMQLNRWNLAKSYTYLKRLRPAIQPNLGFQLVLRDWEKEVLGQGHQVTSLEQIQDGLIVPS